MSKSNYVKMSKHKHGSDFFVFGFTPSVDFYSFDFFKKTKSYTNLMEIFRWRKCLNFEICTAHRKYLYNNGNSMN